MTPLETDLLRIAELTAARHDEFEVLRYQLELDDDIDDARLDTLVEQLAAPIRAAIDCTQCANCCHKLDVDVTCADVHRLAEGLGTSADAIITNYVDRGSLTDDSEWKLHAGPCRFLKGKLCSVYAHRPDACRIYPAFTPDFRWTLTDLIAGASFCPITYNLLSQVSEQFDRLYPLMVVPK